MILAIYNPFSRQRLPLSKTLVLSPKPLPEMPRNILLSQYFLPLSAVSLGRFVISLNNPHQEFHEPMHDVSLNLTENIQTQYDSLHRSAKQQSLASQLTTFLSSSFTRRLKTSVRITADQAKTYYLNNVGQCFRDAVKSQPTREWIERTIDEGEDIYVVERSDTGTVRRPKLYRRKFGNTSVDSADGIWCSGAIRYGGSRAQWL
jgi:hypothetical protein